MAVTLVCYDGSPGARAAVATAARLLPGEAVVLHVVSVEALVVPTGAGAPVPPDAILPEADLAERGRAVAEEGCRLAVAAGLRAEPVVRQAAGVRGVWKTILDVAGAHGADVVVLGRRGVSAIEAALVGSVADGVVHHADRPVLVVPPADDSE